MSATFRYKARSLDWTLPGRRDSFLDLPRTAGTFRPVPSPLRTPLIGIAAHG